MNQSRSLIRGLTRGFLAALMVSSLVLFAGYFYLHGQDKSGFPDGYDAMQAAPDSHKVVYENEFVRVLEVSVAPAGLLFRCIITGGRVSFWIGIAAVARHIFAIIDPTAVLETAPAPKSQFVPAPGVCSGMKPKPMHAIEVVEKPKSATPVPGSHSSLRIEIKYRP